MKSLSLRLRLALFGAAAILLALALASWGLTALFSAHVERRAVAEMEIELEQVLAGLVTAPTGLNVATPPTDPRFARPYGGLYWQVQSGTQTLRSRSLWDAALTIPDQDVPAGQAHVYRDTGPGGEPLLGVERIVTLANGTVVKAAVAMEATELREARRAFAVALAPYLMLLGAVLIAAQIAQLTLGLRPLRAIGARIAALRAGTERRMGDSWPAEMQPLASEIDALLEAREADIERARHRAADLAHGLKTPLQALMGEVARTRDRGDKTTAASIEQIASSMRDHVDRELARTRVSGQGSANLAELSARIISVLQRTPQGSSVTWSNDVSPALDARVDPSDLAEALGALAENALRHARSRVVISASSAQGMVALAVQDDGPGIPPHELEAVRHRGKRLDETVAGSGLGLSIASDIALSVGGQLLLENTPTGFRATLELPSA